MGAPDPSTWTQLSEMNPELKAVSEHQQQPHGKDTAC